MNEYKLTYHEGYSENTLQRCVDLMNSETEAIYLETNFPGKFTEFCPKEKKKNTGPEYQPSFKPNNILNGASTIGSKYPLLKLNGGGDSSPHSTIPTSPFSVIG